MRRICIAYGFTDCEIYAVTSLIGATSRDKDGNHYTQAVRVQSYGTDLGRLKELNAFSRQMCIRDSLHTVRYKKPLRAFVSRAFPAVSYTHLC